VALGSPWPGRRADLAAAIHRGAVAALRHRRSRPVPTVAPRHQRSRPCGTGSCGRPPPPLRLPMAEHPALRMADAAVGGHLHRRSVRRAIRTAAPPSSVSSGLPRVDCRVAAADFQPGRADAPACCDRRHGPEAAHRKAGAPALRYRARGLRLPAGSCRPSARAMPTTAAIGYRSAALATSSPSTRRRARRWRRCLIETRHFDEAEEVLRKGPNWRRCAWHRCWPGRDCKVERNQAPAALEILQKYAALPASAVPSTRGSPAHC
jgi:hypothetical protein